MSSIIEYKTILFEIKSQVARIKLNRPEIHNAINDMLIDELTDVYDKLNSDDNIRVIVMTGEGKSFCAGADLNWMKSVIHYSYEQNYEESLKLAKLMHLIYSHSKPVIAKVNGSAVGGGVGLMSTCDIVVANEDAKFGLSEVRLGLVPAVISPYVILRIGQARAKELFITSERISAHRAEELNLVNRVVPAQELDKTVEDIVYSILQNGPNAVRIAKEMIHKSATMNFDEVQEYNAELIANLRTSEEGQEGMNAFLEKRKPAWVKKSE
ncbi:MAG: enoyl-CoA hydratase/isomerase family protein [Bacteroidota bacterium]